jgi:hypothetical protein
MGTVATTPTNTGLSDLLQTLTNENSPLLATISSPKIEAALQNAPAEDIAKISDEAVQLQDANALFAQADPSNSSTDSLFSELASLSNGTAAPSASTSPTSLANQLAAYQQSSQTQATQTLLGINPSATPFDVLA